MIAGHGSDKCLTLQFAAKLQHQTPFVNSFPLIFAFYHAF
jgi:hypothetical protein